MENRDAARILQSGVASLDPLDDDERDTFYSLMGILFGNFENAFFHHRQGTMEAEHWNRWVTAIGWYVGFPGVAVWWRHRKAVYSAEFRALVDSENGARGPTDPSTWAPAQALPLD